MEFHKSESYEHLLQRDEELLDKSAKDGLAAWSQEIRRLSEDCARSYGTLWDRGERRQAEDLRAWSFFWAVKYKEATGELEFPRIESARRVGRRVTQRGGAPSVVGTRLRRELRPRKQSLSYSDFLPLGEEKSRYQDSLFVIRGRSDIEHVFPIAFDWSALPDWLLILQLEGQKKTGTLQYEPRGRDSWIYALTEAELHERGELQGEEPYVYNRDLQWGTLSDYTRLLSIDIGGSGVGILAIRRLAPKSIDQDYGEVGNLGTIEYDAKAYDEYAGIGRQTPCIAQRGG